MAIIEIRDVLDNETGQTIFPRTHVDAIIGLKDTNFFEAISDGNGGYSVKLKSEYTGLWAEGWMAAGGVGTGGGGGGGGTDLATVWASLTNSVADAYANTTINLSHIPDITTAKVSDIDTWISGKGYLTSADISQLSSRISALESESFFELVNGNVTLKPAYYNLWVPGWLASGDIGGGSGGSGGMDIDSELSSSSVNPVQNRVITNALGLKADASVTCFVGEIVETV